jgi:4-amino-4-deoxy-L-arabinose transferase-like glycosyltransferase
MSFFRSPALVVAAVAALVLLPNLGGPPLWDDDEPRNAACSLAMLQRGDWIVPTFNGRLRVEKPVLVNWLHLAGFTVAGVNETGARLGSAVLTIGSSLLTMHVARMIFRPDVGLWAGIVMASCLWTGVVGRAATPDALLAFCTTLALWAFVRGARVAGPDGTGWRHGRVQVSLATACGIGSACGLAVLAKGPVGVILPLAGLGGFCWWQAAADPGLGGGRFTRLTRGFTSAWTGLRPVTILATAGAVAAPWYVLVTLRTDGVWLRDFLLVHNVARFAAPMEGHSGSTLLYYPVVLLVGTFPWSMAWLLVAGHAARALTSASADAVGVRLASCWLVAWVVPFSIAGTKLPGYVWPAYPAVALVVGLFVADWIRRPAPITDGWMRVAWGCLAASGVAIGIGLPLVAGRFAPGAEWLGVIGLVPVAGAAIAWACQSAASRQAAAAAWACTACVTVGLIVAVGPHGMGHAGGTRGLITALPEAGAAPPLASFAVPASATFYATRHAGGRGVTPLEHPTQAAAFVAANPGGHVVVNARFEEHVLASLPDHYGVLDAATSFPTSYRVLVIGPRGDRGRIASTEPPAPPGH